MQVIETLPNEAWMKLVIDGIERAVKQRDEPRLRHAPNSWTVQQMLRKKVGGEIAELIAQAMRSREGVENAIRHAEEQRQEINAGTHRELKWARERIEAESAYLSAELRDLAKALGLPAETTTSELCDAVRQAARRLAEDAEVQRLRRLFERIQEATADGVLPLPGEQQEAIPA
jgi:hypothetical protein